jgi:hypothetical protein
VLYFADKKWWDWHKEKPAFKAFSGEKATVFVTGHLVDDPEVAMLRVAGVPGISTDPAEICTGSNSGHQALNIAVLTGASRIVLVGYDARPVNGKTHFFGDHPDRTQAPYANMIVEMKKTVEFFKMQKQIEVLNATPGSAIKCFPQIDLLDALAAA